MGRHWALCLLCLMEDGPEPAAVPTPEAMWAIQTDLLEYGEVANQESFLTSL